MARRLILLALAPLVACGGDDSTAGDGGAPASDAAVDHASASDASNPTDSSGVGDASHVDAPPQQDSALPDVALDTGIDTGTDTGADTGGACNAVVNAASVVTIAGVAGTLPTGSGGTIPAGTYWLAAVNQYSPDGGSGVVGHTVRQTQVWTAAGTGFDYQSVTSYDATPDVHTTGGADVSNPPQIGLQEVCPSGLATAGTYTYDATARVLHLYDQVTNSESVFALQ
jgi:hypothetical protein